MPPELIALIDKPVLLALVLAAGAAIGMAVERFTERLNRAQRRLKWTQRRGLRPMAEISRLSPVDMAADQLRRVMQAPFAAKLLLNRGERRLLSVIDQALAEHTPGWRAMAQVSLGEILTSPQEDAFLAINSKRVDLLIVDAQCRPLHAIEFQGQGHHRASNTAARDAAKKEALRRAGIGYVEVVSGDTPAQVKEMLRKLAARSSAA